MALANPITIEYGSRSLGGNSTLYLLHDPYTIEQSHDAIRISATVVVTAGSLTDLQTACEDLETDLSKRDQDFSITIDGNEQSWAFGDTVLNTSATIAKSGDPELDRGVSRAYVLEITGTRPASDDEGLRDITVQVDYEPSRQKTVTISGTYTAYDGSTATEQYDAEIDSRASVKLTAIDSSATFELASEQTQVGRNDHTMTFTRQYVELLADQSQAALDDTAIKDHRVSFQTQATFPGDGAADVFRLQRAIATYDCAVDITDTTDLQSVFDDKVLPHLKALFQQNYESQAFAIEDQTVRYSETEKRISANVQFAFVPGDGERVVEVAQSVSYEEGRTPVFTPVHSGGEFDAYVDPGFAIRERVWVREVSVFGNDVPRRRIGTRDGGGDAGPIPSLGGIESVDTRNDGTVQESGWSVMQNSSQVSKQFLGNPTDGDVIELTILRETVRERYTSAPAGGTTTPITPGGVA